MIIHASARAAPKPTETLPAGATCVTSECHSSMAKAARLHGPLDAGQCDTCHREDQGGHTFPLRMPTNSLCASCHTVAGTQANQHAAIANAGCTVCHDPHASDYRFLLTRATEGELCATCHDMPMRRYAHDPYVRQQCTLCHFAHQSDTKSLLRGGDGREHCLSCHKGVGERLVAEAGGSHDAVMQACTSCHNPHSTAFPKLLKSVIRDNCATCHEQTDARMKEAHVSHGATKDERSCANCHEPHGSRFEHLLADREDRLCLRCHDQPIELANGRTIANMKPVLDQRYPHGPVAVGFCSGCHDDHGAAFSNLLREPFSIRFYGENLREYQLCFTCHSADTFNIARSATVTDFRNGDVNLHFIHARQGNKTRTCQACHAIHASEHPAHIADTVAFEGSTWAMPIRFEKLASGGSCAPGCHQPLRYDRDAPIPKPQSSAKEGAR